MDIKILLNYIEECKIKGIEATLEGLTRYSKKVLISDYEKMC